MSATRLAKVAIKIPKRIERGPTDILKALASTVRHIPTEPDTIIHDDPYLLPVRPFDRTVYSLSKISGKKTAKFLLNKHPELFFRDDAEPKIEAFLPPEEYRADMEFTENDLLWCIDNYDPLNGLIAYNALEERKINLNDETLLKFFEMICYSNEDKMMEYTDFQKDYFGRDLDRQLVKRTWKLDGLASKIFNRIKEELNPPRVYSAMIAGLSKYHEHGTAKQVFEDFKEFHPNEALFVDAYEGLMASVPNLNSSIETAHGAIDEIVQHMEQHLVMPSLRVFNSILGCYSKFICDENTCRKSLNLINDMRTLGIEPSLFTYQSLFYIFNRSRIPIFKKHIEELVNYIISENASLEMRDDRDVMFLRDCMRLFASLMNNLTLANKLHKIYMKKPTLFVNLNHRQQYLNNYFRLVITTERLETIISFYDSYVPMVFRPNPDVYDALAEALDLYQADESTIKRISHDVIQFKLADKIKNDAIFRRDPQYVKALEETLNRYS